MTLPDSGIERLVTEARPTVFWSDRPEAPTANRALGQRRRADLVIIGGGFTGLWTALHAARQEPGREIVILEAEVCGFGASSRNGGFCAASLTHGLLNGIAHWPDEIATLDRMGRQNLAELIADCESLQIDASIERSGELCVATASWQSDHLVEMRDVARTHGSQLELLDETAVRGQLDSPTYRSGLWDPDGTVMVDPARLVWGLQRSCIDAGVRIYDNSRVNDVSRVGSALEVSTDDGVVTAPKVVVATNAWGEPGLDPAIRGSRVRPRADDGATGPGATRLDRLVESARGGGLGQPVSLLPTHRRQPNSLGRPRRELLPGQRDGAGVRAPDWFTCDDRPSLL